MKDLLNILALGIPLLILYTCLGVFVGRRLSSGYEEEIRIDETTKDEIRERLGEPQKINQIFSVPGPYQLEGQNEIWTYMYGREKMSFWSAEKMFGRSANLELQTLTIIFQGDVVKDFSLNRNGPLRG